MLVIMTIIRPVIVSVRVLGGKQEKLSPTNLRRKGVIRRISGNTENRQECWRMKPRRWAAANGGIWAVKGSCLSSLRSLL